MMGIDELTMRLNEILRAMGWALSPIYEDNTTLVGVVMAAPDVIESKVAPDADIWSPTTQA
jgi:hypothetical protein